MSNKIHGKANEILKRELKGKWHEKTYEKVRRDPECYGFTSKYLQSLANFNKFSSTAKTSVLVKLAKLDLKKGTTIPQLVFSCCIRFPKKEAIKSLIDLEKPSKSLVERVLKFQNDEGFNCLIGLFDMATKCRNKYREYPHGPMLDDIETSCSYLIHLARSTELDLNKILNHTTKSGETLFLKASIFSEEITDRLLKENVRINSINHIYLTPFFRVSFPADYWK